LFHSVPMGYVILPTGEVDFDPDEQARNVMQTVFEKFDELGSIYGLFHWLIQHDVQMPVRAPLPLSKTAPGFLSLNGPLLGKKKMVFSSK
jgi:hypothetical protein